MDPRGIVRAVEGDTVLVEIVREEACGSCGASSVCFPERPALHVVRAQNRAAAGIGESVVVTLERGTVLGASSLSYGLLLGGLLAGLLIGHGVGGSDWATALGAFLGLAAGALAVWHSGRTVAGRGLYSAVATRPERSRVAGG